jgi:hypothetical protein
VEEIDIHHRERKAQTWQKVKKIPPAELLDKLLNPEYESFGY